MRERVRESKRGGKGIEWRDAMILQADSHDVSLVKNIIVMGRAGNGLDERRKLRQIMEAKNGRKTRERQTEKSE